MNRYLKVGLFGFFIWLIPFIVSVLIFPLRAMQRPLFESIMPVVIAIWTVFFAVIYLLGIIYLMIPTITFGFGYLMEKYSSRSG